MAKKKDFAPVPAIAAGTGPFWVTVTPPTVGVSRLPHGDAPGLLAVPDDDSPEAMAVRAHEYGHLALFDGPLNERDLMLSAARRGIRPDWLQSGVDVVVNSFLNKRGVYEYAKLTLRNPGKSAPMDDRARYELERWGLHDGDVAIGSDLPGPIRKMISMAGEQLQRLGKYAAEGIPIDTDHLMTIIESMQILTEVHNPEKPQRQDSEAEDDEGEGESKGLDEKEQEIQERAVQGIPEQRGKPIWGDMRIITLPFTRKIKAALDANKRVAGYVGAFLYPSRFLTDGMIFGYRRRAPGGTLLFDLSGSMNLEMQEIEQVMTLRPAATIAVYASDRVNMSRGILAIAGRMGMSATTRSIRDAVGMGNIVDGPALKWLIKQPEPRVWISDGLVTGKNEALHPALVHDAFETARKGKVKRYDDVKDYLKATSKGSE